KLARWLRYGDRNDQVEYYLGLEGFLLHYRNLLGFFVNKGCRATDLIIRRSEHWANGEPVEGHRYGDLVKRAKEINERYGTEDERGRRVDCYQKISWFLQHCTTYRHSL